ncbi:MAG TPA: phosphatase PAP2 family protein [Acidimicrobiales bacterium]|jgi:hypothetical protein|nr:phosphatase PAP2 family protein [Acidimicrobiales bacterium]
MWLAWDAAAWLAAGLGVVMVITARARDRRVQAVRAFGVEITIILALYALWQRAGMLSIMHTDHAMSRGRSIWKFERAWHLPNEVTIQRWVLPHSLLSQLCNRYYAYLHVPTLGIFLLWLFVRHRDRYPSARTTLAIATGGCLAIQLVPVAPPRMFPDLGFVDLAQRYHQSVYSPLGTGLADQLSAMPSVHVAWAVLVGFVAWRLSSSRWRYLAVAHMVITIFVVTVTANHWLLDGIVAVAVLAASWLVQQSIRTAWRRMAAAWRDRSDAAGDGGSGGSRGGGVAEGVVDDATPSVGVHAH